MAREIFIIYDKNTGYIDGGAGRIDRKKDVAGVGGISMEEVISNTLKENSNLRVLYLPDQGLPDHEEKKIKNKKIVDTTENDRKIMEENFFKEEEYAMRPSCQVLMEFLKGQMAVMEKRIIELEAQKADIE